jgi:cytidine deaminase
MARSHSPYSSYPVGAAIRTTGGATFVGCNVENAAYPEGTCAEAGAIAAMVAGTDGHPVIAQIVTVTASSRAGSPCGGCRQKIREFSDASTVVQCCTVEGLDFSFTMDESLPDPSGPEDLLPSPDERDDA